MRTIIMALAATMFTIGVNAGDVYHGLEQGNPDLAAQWMRAEDVTAVQPSIGDTVEPYQGIADGNPDVCKSDRTGYTGKCEDPEIYGSVSGNPDLAF